MLGCKAWPETCRFLPELLCSIQPTQLYVLALGSGVSIRPFPKQVSPAFQTILPSCEKFLKSNAKFVCVCVFPERDAEFL